MLSYMPGTVNRIYVEISMILASEASATLFVDKRNALC